jgi:hypothetical protein
MSSISKSVVTVGADSNAKKRKIAEIDPPQNLRGVVEPRHVTEKRLRDRHDRNDLVRRVLEVERLALRMIVQRLTYRTDDTAELLESFANITQGCGYCKVPFLEGNDDFVIGCTKCNIKICKIHVGHGFLCNCPDPAGFLPNLKSLPTSEESLGFAKFEQVLNRYGESIGNRVWHKKLPGTNPVPAGYSTKGLLDEISESCSDEGETRESESPQQIIMRDIKKLMKQRFLKPKPTK